MLASIVPLPEDDVVLEVSPLMEPTQVIHTRPESPCVVHVQFNLMEAPVKVVEETVHVNFNLTSNDVALNELERLVQQLRIEIDACKEENEKLKSSSSEGSSETISSGCDEVCDEQQRKDKKPRRRNPIVKARMAFYHAKKAEFKKQVEQSMASSGTVPWQMVRAATNEAFHRMSREEQLAYL